jgi:hypothetical protein
MYPHHLNYLAFQFVNKSKFIKGSLIYPLRNIAYDINMHLADNCSYSSQFNVTFKWSRSPKPDGKKS